MRSKKLLLCILSTLLGNVLTTCYENYASRDIHFQKIELPNDSLIDKPISIEQAVKIAFANRSNLLAAYYATKATQKGALAALAGYFTQIAANAFIKTSRKKFFHKEGQELAINQLIWSFAGPLQSYYIEKQNVYIAQLVELLEQDGIQFGIETSFLNFWIIQNQKYSKHALDLFSQMDFAKAQRENTVGLLSSQDWLDQVAIFAERSFIVTSFFDDLERIQYVLERNLERSFKNRGLAVQLNDNEVQRFIRDNIIAAGEGEKKPVDQFLKLAQLNRKELLIKDEEVTRERLVAEFFARTYLPSASFFTVVTRKGLPVGAPKLMYQVGLRFDWVFDGLQNAFRSQANRYVELATIAARQNVYQGVKVEVESTYENLKVALKRLEFQRIRTRQAETQYQSELKRFEVGEISYVIYADAEHLWEVAKFNLLDAEVSTAVTYRELLFRCGYPGNEYV